MKNDFWTSERIQILRKRWQHKRSWEIGNEIGCTGNAVIGKARRLGLPAIDRRMAGARQSITNREKIPFPSERSGHLPTVQSVSSFSCHRDGDDA